MALILLLCHKSLSLTLFGVIICCITYVSGRKRGCLFERGRRVKWLDIESKEHELQALVNLFGKQDYKYENGIPAIPSSADVDNDE